MSNRVCPMKWTVKMNACNFAVGSLINSFWWCIITECGCATKHGLVNVNCKRGADIRSWENCIWSLSVICVLLMLMMMKPLSCYDIIENERIFYVNIKSVWRFRCILHCRQNITNHLWLMSSSLNLFNVFIVCWCHTWHKFDENHDNYWSSQKQLQFIHRKLPKESWKNSQTSESEWMLEIHRIWVIRW